MPINGFKSAKTPPVAIISIGCFFPHATGLKAYWHLLYHGKDAIGDIPASHWSPNDYFDEDTRKPDHVYCRRGGFLSPIAFDPTAFGIPPSNLEATDTSQILALLAAQTALERAGYGEKVDFDRDRTAVILGVTGTQELVIPLSSRLSWPQWKRALDAAGVDAERSRRVMDQLSSSYVDWQENSFPGLLGNVVAGRICNRLNLSGTNCVVDAACASSMSAVNLALMELYADKARMVVTGGVDTLNDIFMHMCFARTQILSPTGDARPFSRHADGTVLGEGIGILIMKRLADAEADQDPILAVVRGIGSSSDGKSQSIYAPRAAGQLKALHQAYDAADIAPETVGLIEAHGTGTRVGDKVEIQALSELFGPIEGPPRCALGSVKSMIGHTKAAAGAAGLIKAVLALRHKVLPPTLKAEEVDPDLHLDQSPFYINRQVRPWFRTAQTPRRAGVSAFGFGGSNFHMVLEEHGSRRREVAWDGSVEIVALSDTSPEALRAALQHTRQALGEAPPEAVPNMARRQRSIFDPRAPHRLLMVLSRNEDTQGPRWNTDAVCDEADQALQANVGAEVWQTRACCYGSGPRPGGLAFLFPGQGSQYTHMARDLVAWFPEALASVELAARHFSGNLPLTDLIYPLPAEGAALRDQEEALRHTAAAQPAIGAVSVAMDKILRRFGLAPEATCGHSYGELTALYSAGWIEEETLYQLSALRGQLMAAAGGQEGEASGSMLAVKAPLEDLDRLLDAENLDVVLANRNSPNQGVLSGETEAIQRAAAVCKAHKFRTVRLPVSAAFHSRLVEKARAPFAEALQSVAFAPSSVPVLSNTTGDLYPTAPEAIRALLGDHLRNPVNFIGEIEALYRRDHRIFLEVGPKTVLTGLVRSILKGRDFHALALDASSGKSFGILDLAHLLCHLAALGCPIAWDAWENEEDPPPPMKMRIPVTGANQRSKPTGNGTPRGMVSGPEPRAAAQTQDTRGRAPEPALSDEPHAPQPPASAAAASSVRSQAATGKPAPAVPFESERHSVNQPKHSVLEALQVIQEGLRSLQTLQAQTVEAHQKFLDTQQQASRTLQEMMAGSQRFAEAALGLGRGAAGPQGPGIHPVTPAVASSRSLPAEPQTASDAPPVAQDTYPQDTIPASTEEPSGEDLTPQADTPIAQILLQVVSDLTGYPAEMLNLDMRIENDLGIDSIKRVEILSQIEARLPSLPPLTPDRIAEFETLGEVATFLGGKNGNQPPAVPYGMPHPTASAAAAGSEAPSAAILLEVVSDLTGYPVEMLSLEMDVEADLGIDSIKRVEILSALEDRMPAFPAVAPEEMTALKTLGQIAARLAMTSQETPPAAASPQAAPQDPLNNSRQAVEAILMAVVSDLTGYPVDTLSPDMDIEADLGIDSIKRVEILSAMEDQLAAVPSVSPDEMAGLKTIAQIAAVLAGAQTTAEKDSTTPVSFPPTPSPEGPHAGHLLRRTLRAVETPRPPAAEMILPKDRKIFITTDKTGLSHALADQLAAKGLPTVQISADILKHRAALPEAAGLILLGEGEESGDQATGRLKTFLADAFELTRHLAPSLQASARQGGALLASISRLDGTFAVEDPPGGHPYQGGLAGLVKTAALEWPGVVCRALDVDPRWQDNPAIAAQIVAELLLNAPASAVEVGLQRRRRITLDLTPAPIPEDAPRTLNLEDGDVVVISGGARGVTAAAAEALARCRALTLILLGRSPMPFDEPEWLAGRSGEAELKKAIAAHGFAAARPTPQAIEEAFRRYAANRVIQDTLARITASGAAVRYVSLDIRDADRVRAVLEDIRLVHGPIKALIHGAGVLRDRAIADKTVVEFQAVFETKVEGLQNLLDATREDPLRYIVFFSSVAARFGNVGQADYAAANEVLNKIAAALAAQYQKCRVRAINWGPWDGGMVNPALKRVFTEKQIPLIPLALGSEAFVAELTAPDIPGVEVVIGSDLAASPLRGATEAPAPAASPAIHSDQGLSTAFISELNLDHYPILDHHRLDGKPVVPFALMAEWFGHGALHNHPGYRLYGLDDMRILKGIVLDERQRPIRVLAGSARPSEVGFSVMLELRDGLSAGAEVIHSRATALLVEALPAPPVYVIPETLRQDAYGRDTVEVYADILFHGEALQGLQRVRACNASGMRADLTAAPDPENWIRTPPRNRWIADPLVLDGAFQMASLWCYEETGQVSLPSYAAAYRQYCRRFPTESIQAVLEVRDLSRHKLVADVTFLDREERVLAQLKGCEAVMQEQLIKAFKPERRAAAR